MAETKTRYGIPVGPDGYVPENELIKHFERTMARKQREYDERRSAAELSGEKMPNISLAKRDYDNTSDTVIPLKCKPEQVAAWWRDPTCCDVQDIDTAGAPKVNIPSGMTPGQKREQGRIKVVSTPSEEQKFRRELAMTYSPEDIRKFAACHPTVAIKPTGVGYSGRYIPSRDRIELDRKDGLNQGTIAHEGGHLLRNRDLDRKNVITKFNRDSIGIEESCTVAEQMARSDKPDYTGYYMSVAVYDDRKHAWRRPTPSEARRMADEDHLLFTYGRGKGLKGEEALRSVEQNWENSHISRLFIDGGMAVNVMARIYGNVRPVSMAKPRTERERDEASKIEVTNATAGKPGVAEAGRQVKQMTLFRKRSVRDSNVRSQHSCSPQEPVELVCRCVVEQFIGTIGEFHKILLAQIGRLIHECQRCEVHVCFQTER